MCVRMVHALPRKHPQRMINLLLQLAAPGTVCVEVSFWMRR